ncbi:HCP-like protein, partial [Gonapodya prolifera JEL478]
YYCHAADQGHVVAQTRLGFMLMHRYGVKWDYKEAVKWFKKAAEEQNFPVAKVLLAECYLLGLGVEENLEQAIRYLSDVAQDGNADAQFNMGMVCEHQNNFDGAKSWYKEAVKQGHAGAMANLGDLYFHGVAGGDLYKDRNEGIRKAVEWYTRASDQGHPRGREHLGYCYYRGLGV